MYILDIILLFDGEILKIWAKKNYIRQILIILFEWSDKYTCYELFWCLSVAGKSIDTVFDVYLLQVICLLEPTIPLLDYQNSKKNKQIIPYL